MKKKKNLILIIITLLFFLFLLSIIFAIINMNSSKIFAGISINNVDISGFNTDEANMVLSKILKDKSNKQIKFIYDDLEYNISFSDFNIHYNLSNTIISAYNIGKSGNIIQNNYAILGSLLFKNNIYTDISFDEDSLKSIIKNISLELPNKLIEPNYYIENDNLIITKGKSGNVIDEEELKKSLSSYLQDFSSKNNIIQIPVKQLNCNEIDIEKIHSEVYKEVKDAYYEENPFKVFAEVIGVDFDKENAKSVILNHPDDTEYVIPLNYTKPNITVENLNINVFTDLLATFSTRYNAMNESRSTNLELAGGKINGTILAPNSEFSYNKVVGERSIAAGYKEAKVYSNGQVVDGIGGGICQISSTLYNAAVFANLKVTERYNHQFICSYVSPGRDATVVYGVKDLKFINTRKYPIKIIVSLNSGIAKVDIYGIKEDTEYDVSFDIETISDTKYNVKYEKDNSIEPNKEVIKQAGAMGGTFNSYKILKKGSTIVSKEFLYKDTYTPMDRIILTKTGKPIN